MCGGSGTTTQQVSIPPEVLARYNSVNAQAQQVAQQPFHIYSTDPSAFVAPINPQQMAGIENINQAANIPAPYFGAATQYLTGAAGAAQPYFDYASQQLTGGAQAGLAGTTAAYNPMAAGAQYAQGLQGGALGQYGAATSMAQPYNYLAGENIMGAQAGARPYQQAATTFGLAGATPVMPGQLGSEQINRYMSPYMSNVVEATLAPLRQQQQIEQSTLAGNQIGAGAFGGERGRIAQAVLAQQQNLATAKTAADLLQQGYGQALGTAQQQQQLGLGAEQANRQAIQQASQQMLGIGQQGFGQGLASSQALSGLGQQVYGQQAGYGQNLAQLAQQGFGQGAAQTAQQAALAQQLYGIGTGTAGQAATLGQGVYGLGANTAQSLAGLGTGAQQAALQGAQAQIGAGTLGQQTQQAGLQALYNQFLQQQGYPFQVAQFLANIAMGTGALSGTTTQTTQPMGFMGSLSDKRAKEDIEPIGKTFDGQDIVKYRYKGEPQKQIGLIAQDVEKHHPEAVGLAGGLKTVDYDRATKDAAEIGKSSEGGKVIPFPERRGYFDGGYAGGLSPNQIGEILASQAQMYGGTDHPGLGESRGTTPGLSGYVPGASLPVGELMSPTSAPELPKTTLQDIDAGIGLYKSGKSLFEDEDDKDGSPSKRYGGGLSRHHYAIGGDANAPYGGNDMPYGDEDTKSNVPTSIPGLAGASKMEKPEPLKPASAPSSSGSSDLQDLATLAKFAMMFANRGGAVPGYYSGGLVRHGYALDGGVFGSPAGGFDPELERRQIADALVRQRDLSEDPAARPPEPRLARPIVPTATAPQFKTEPSFFVQPSTPKAEMPQFGVDSVDRGLLAKSQNAPVLAPSLPNMKSAVIPRVKGSFTMPSGRQSQGFFDALTASALGAGESAVKEIYNPKSPYIVRYGVAPALAATSGALSLIPASINMALGSEADKTTFFPQRLPDAGKTYSFDTKKPFYEMGSDIESENKFLTRGLVPGRQTTSNIGASNVSRPAPRKPGLGGSGNVNLVPPVVAGPGYMSGDENRRVSALEGMYEPENIGGLNPPTQTAEGMMGGDVAGGLSAGDIKSIPAGGLAGAPATQRAEVLPPESKAGEGRDFLTRAGDFLAPKGGFFDKLSEGKEEAIIPLLRGLGAAATSNNRYLLGSLLAGAGAGAAAYQPTQAAMIERASKKLDLGPNFPGKVKMFDKNGNVVYVTRREASKNIVSGEQKYFANPFDIPAIGEETGATVGTPSNKSSIRALNNFMPQIIQNVEDAGTSIYSADGEDIDPNKYQAALKRPENAYANSVISELPAMLDTRMGLTQLTTFLPTSQQASGAWVGNVVNTIVKNVNGLVNATPFISPETKARILLPAETKAVSADVIEKVNNTLALLSNANQGSPSVQQLQVAMGSLINMTQDPKARAEVMSSLMAANMLSVKQGRMLKDIYNQAKNEANGDGNVAQVSFENLAYPVRDKAVKNIADQKEVFKQILLSNLQFRGEPITKYIGSTGDIFEKDKGLEAYIRDTLVAKNPSLAEVFKRYPNVLKDTSEWFRLNPLSE